MKQCHDRYQGEKVCDGITNRLDIPQTYQIRVLDHIIGHLLQISNVLIEPSRPILGSYPQLGLADVLFQTVIPHSYDHKWYSG